MHIRTLVLEDLPRVLAIRYDAFQAIAWDYYSAQEVKVLLQDVSIEELRTMIELQQLFGCEEGGVLVGVAGWFEGVLRHVYVDPASQGKGVGGSLLAYVEKQYKSVTQAEEIKTGVTTYAVSFYEKQGYDVVEKATDWDGSRFVRMVKPL